MIYINVKPAAAERLMLARLPDSFGIQVMI